MIRFKGLVLSAVLLGLATSVVGSVSYANCDGKNCKKERKECDCQRKEKKKVECKDCEKKKADSKTE